MEKEITDLVEEATDIIDKLNQKLGITEEIHPISFSASKKILAKIKQDKPKPENMYNLLFTYAIQSYIIVRGDNSPLSLIEQIFEKNKTYKELLDQFFKEYL